MRIKNNKSNTKMIVILKIAQIIIMAINYY